MSFLTSNVHAQLNSVYSAAEAEQQKRADMISAAEQQLRQDWSDGRGELLEMDQTDAIEKMALDAMKTQFCFLDAAAESVSDNIERWSVADTEFLYKHLIQAGMNPDKEMLLLFVQYYGALPKVILHVQQSGFAPTDISFDMADVSMADRTADIQTRIDNFVNQEYQQLRMDINLASSGGVMVNLHETRTARTNLSESLSGPPMPMSGSMISAVDGEQIATLTSNMTNLDCGDSLTFLYNINANAVTTWDFISLFYQVNQQQTSPERISWEWVKFDRKSSWGTWLSGGGADSGMVSGSARFTFPPHLAGYFHAAYYSFNGRCLGVSHSVRVGPVYKVSVISHENDEGKCDVLLERTFGGNTNGGVLALHEGSNRQRYTSFRLEMGQNMIQVKLPKTGLWEFHVYPFPTCDYSAGATAYNYVGVDSITLQQGSNQQQIICSVHLRTVDSARLDVNICLYNLDGTVLLESVPLKRAQANITFQLKQPIRLLRADAVMAVSHRVVAQSGIFVCKQ